MDTVERINLLIHIYGKNRNIVSKECGLNNTALYEWSRGKAKPSTEAIVKLADYFNVSTDYLLGITDEKARPNTKNELYEKLDEEKELLLGTYEQLPKNSQERLLGYAQCLLDTANAKKI